MAVVVVVVASEGGFIYFFFLWCWSAATSCGFGFAKKVVGFQRRGESQIRRERKRYRE